MMAKQPHESFNLSQIARHLGVSTATCLPMVASLTAAGWLIRHPIHKTYRLGAALVTIGRAAEQSGPLGQTALPHMVEMSALTGLPCVAFVPTGDQLMIAEVTGPSGPQATWTGLTRGHRITPVPPLGSCMVTWHPGRLDNWLRRGASIDIVAERARYEPAIRASRDRGFVVELEHNVHRQLFFITQRLRAGRHADTDALLDELAVSITQDIGSNDYVATTLEPGELYQPVSVNAPVFGPYGEVELVICLTDVPEPIAGSEVVRLGELIRQHTLEITADIGGNVPII